MEASPAGSSLAAKVVSGGVWMFSSRMFLRALSLIKTVIIARILLPADLGIINISLICISILEVFTNTGVQSALVQRKNIDQGHYHTAWTINAVRGIFISGLLFFLAGPIAAFFSEPAAFRVVQVISLVFLFRALSNIATINFQREMDFRSQFIFEAAPQLVNLISTLALIFFYRNFWAVIIGSICGEAARLIVSFLLIPARVKLALDWDRARQLMGFGLWIMLIQVIFYVTLQIDKVVIGRMLDTTMLGYYGLAFSLTESFLLDIGGTINNVVFPVFSKLQSETGRARAGLVRTFDFSAAMAFAFGFMFLVLAPYIVTVVFTAKWEPILDAMRILIVCAMIRTVMLVFSPFFTGIGKPQYPLYYSLIRLLVMAFSIIPLVSAYSIEGAAWSSILALVLPLPIYMYFLEKVQPEILKELSSSFFINLLVSLFAFYLVWQTSCHLPERNLSYLLLLAMEYGVLFALGQVVVYIISKKGLIETVLRLKHIWKESRPGGERG